MMTTQDRLLTVQELAEILTLPVSWVYEHTKAQCHDPLPHLKLGKYLRFEESLVRQWLEKRRT